MNTGRREKRVRCMERVTWKLTLPYVKWIANGNFLYGSGNSNKGSVSTYSKNDAFIIVFVLLPCWKHHVVGDQLSLQLPFPQTASFQKLLHLRGFRRYFHNVDLR